MTLRERLDNLKRKQEAARDRKARAEATLEQLRAQEAEIRQELEKLGVTPDNVHAEIQRLESEVQERLKEAEEILQGVPV